MALKIANQSKFSHFFCPNCCIKGEPSLFIPLESNSKELLSKKKSILHKQLISLINHIFCSLNCAVRSSIRKESLLNSTVRSSIRTESSLNSTVWSSIRVVCSSIQAEAFLSRMARSLN